MLFQSTDLECRRCGSSIELQRSDGSPVAYYLCPGCARRIPSGYPEALRHAARPSRSAERDAAVREERRELTELRGRLESFLARFESPRSASQTS